MAAQTDGKIIVAGGTSPKKFAVARLLADGTSDTTFGTDGLVETTVLSVNTLPLKGVVVQADGKIVAVGPAIGPGPTSYDFVVLRYNTNGTLDSTFGDAGAVVTDFGNTDDYPRSIALQPDGRILVAGENQLNAMASTTNFIVARYNTDGSLDASFGTGGKVTIDVKNTPDEGGYVALLPGGKIMVAGASGTVAGGSPYEMSAVRLNSNGSLDTTFANGGKMVTTFGGSGDHVAYAVVADVTGRTTLGGVFGGTTPDDFGLVRLSSAGGADPTFGDSGVVSTDFSSAGDALDVLLLQSDGRLLGAGNSQTGANPTSMALARYLTNGQLDPAFGTAGRSLTPSPASTSLVAVGGVIVGCTFVTVGTWGYDLNTLAKNAMGVARYRL